MLYPSLPIKEVLKRISGASNYSLRSEIVLPSGS
jgi:hypothetical protein